MGMELVKTQQLWLGEAIDIGAIGAYTATGVNWWWNTANTFTRGGDVPTAAWFTIDVADADVLYVCYAGAIAAVAGAATVTSDALSARAVGILKGESETGGLLGTAFKGLSSQEPQASADLTGNELGISSASSDGTVENEINGFGVALHNSAQLSDEATPRAAAAGDRSQWRLRIGDYLGEHGDLTVSMYDKVYLAVYHRPVSSATNIDITSYTGEMTAITFKDIQAMDKVDRRNPQRIDKFVNIPAGS